MKQFKNQDRGHWDTCFDLEHVAIIIMIADFTFLPTLSFWFVCALGGAITGFSEDMHSERGSGLLASCIIVIALGHCVLMGI